MLKILKEIAEQKGGKCLSAESKNVKTKLLWECRNKHQWDASARSIKYGSWCPTCCGNKKQTIDQMKELAKQRGGTCLSQKYLNSQSKLIWQCELQHQWSATPANVKKGSWCPVCSGNLKLSLAHIQDYAFKKKGRCVSTVYINARTKLQWECEFHHRWEASWDTIKGGSWCPKCGGKERLTLAHMQLLAKKRDGKCLSLAYKDYVSKLLWVCEFGHQWAAAPNNIQRGTWCPCCAGNGKLTLAELNEIAKVKGGKCLSTKYKNCSSKQLWECEFGHQWESSVNTIKYSNSWCPTCAGNKKLTLEKMQNIAKQKAGKCLSIKYKNNSSKLLWECEFGHQWKAIPASIIKNTWCPECNGNTKLTIEQMQKIAKQNGGKCLSRTIISNRHKLFWQCHEGHEWQATPGKVKNQGTWCPKCNSKEKLSIEQMHHIAQERKGKCLSTNYINNSSNLLWECELGHQWQATPANLKRGKWCPKCSQSRGEKLLRNFLELLFGLPFPKVRPDWLKIGGNNLELDGYCNDLSLAFEYQGRYHTDPKAFWFKDRGMTFERRQFLDKIKKDICLKKGVKLMILSEFDFQKNPITWKDQIRKELQRLNILIPCSFHELDIQKLQYSSRNLYEIALELATKNNGKCLTTSIFYQTQKITWKCQYGHIWTASFNQVKRLKTWCPTCAGKIRHTIEMMHELAKSKKGKCLSKTYFNARTKLQWECEFGHTWEAIPSSIKNHGTWCPECFGSKKLTIQVMQEIASKRDGECLSQNYVDNKTKLKWMCKYGHQWHASPVKIRAGSWCPRCSGNTKLPIEERPISMKT